MPDHDDNGIRADIRLLVDEGGPASSQEALQEVMRRGRRKRRHKHIAAVAGVLTVVAGIGTAMTTVPNFAAEKYRSLPVAGAGSTQRTPEKTRTVQPTPTSERRADPTGSRSRTGISTTTPAGTPACLDSLSSEAITEVLPLPPGIRVCNYGRYDAAYNHAFKIVRSALSGTAATVSSNKGGAVAVVSGSGYTSAVSISTHSYYGDLKSTRLARGVPLVVRYEGADTRSNLEKAMPEPVLLIYFPDGRLFVVRVHSPDPLPWRLVTKIEDELVDWGTE